MGSSLMSVRGYDSDAQCIGSPRFADRMKASPRAPGLRRTGLHDLIERSRERNNSDLQAEAQGCDRSDIRETPGGIYSIPAPPESLRLRVASRTNVDSADGTGSQVLLRNERVDGYSAFMESHPSFRASRERQVPPHQGLSQQAFIGDSSENLQNMTVDWARYMETDPNDYRTGSSTSLARQAQDIMIPKRQPPTSPSKTHSEARVPHPGELVPPHRLASMASGPPSTNPSMLELPPANRYGFQMVSQENLQSSDNSGALTLVDSDPQKQDTRHPRHVSSVYSRQSDNPSGGVSPAIPSLRLHSANAMDGLPNIQTQMVGGTGMVQNGLEPSPEVFKSRFIEQLDQSPKSHGMSSGANGVGPQRKVSPGWMTGGRRMGYGYSLVDNAEDHPQTVEWSGSSHQNGGRHRDVTGPVSGQFARPELSTATKHQNALASAGIPFTPEQEPNKVHSRRPNGVNTEDEAVLTPTMWAKLKSQSLRANAHAPLAVDLAGEQVSTGKAHNAVHVEHSGSPMSANVDYVEDTDEAFLEPWPSPTRSTIERAQPARGDMQTHGRHVYSPNTSPVIERRFSIDQANRRFSACVDPLNNKSVQKLNKEPSRSRSGRWLLRFSRRESKRRSNLSPKEQPGESAVYHQEDGACSLERADSTRSDWAEELASSYQECIHMPGAFHGSGWASRTSLVVEAEE
ncbi:uncharacterized protein N7515_002417 [Penicillium bovifimosum]|uniref:Uncharacterized protein n=1 Tax=Penicillium bovifimosum TaxID=126998 RepID=A0A9W9HBH6_9EURO|nr:uncharacterized protein N7515_002417 [Penicillium bovifimosum]KAJ5143630.1 hypothetical protein N7515_002417 [Penicillium bovifimosum]